MLAVLALAFTTPTFASPTHLECYLYTSPDTNGKPIFDPLTITFDDSTDAVSIGPSNWTFVWGRYNESHTFTFDAPPTVSRMDTDEIAFSIPAHAPDFANGVELKTTWNINRLTGKFVFTIGEGATPFYTSTAYGEKSCIKVARRF
jgi:hypothetical protein